MSDAPPARQSIRRRLLVFLVGTLILLVSAAAVITYLVAVRAANDAYDRALLDPTLELQQNLRMVDGMPHLDLPPKAQEALMYDRTDASSRGSTICPPRPGSRTADTGSTMPITPERTFASPRSSTSRTCSCR